MSTQSVETVGNSGDKVKIAIAVIFALAGVVGFYVLSAQSMLVRTAVLAGGLVIALICVFISGLGKDLIVFFRESWQEARKVVWPERNAALRVMAIVFGFVVIMAICLWVSDKVIEFLLYDLILGWKN